MNRLVSLLCLCALLSTGCQENLAGPEATETAPEVSVLAHEQGHMSTVNFHLSCSAPIIITQAPYTLRINAVLQADGKAAGQAVLSADDDPTERYHFQFQRGEARCEDGKLGDIFVYGEGWNFGEVADDSETPRRRGTFTHTYRFGFDLPASLSGEAASRHRAPTQQIVATLLEGMPEALVGEVLRIEARRAFVSSEICDAR